MTAEPADGGGDAGTDSDGSPDDGSMDDDGGSPEDGTSSPDDGSRDDDVANARDGNTAAERRVRASLLWGLVGALAFLVLVQGYELLGGQAVTVGAKAGVAAAVGTAAAGLSYLLEGWMAERAGRE